MDDKIYLKALQSYMLENDLNQEELAKKLHVSPGAVGKWLLGHNGITLRNKEKIRKLCGKYLSASDEKLPDSALTIINSVGRAALADRLGDPVKSAVEEFRNLAIMAMMDIPMEPELRSTIIRALSNIEYKKR